MNNNFIERIKTEYSELEEKHKKFEEEESCYKCFMKMNVYYEYDDFVSKGDE